MNRPKDSFAFDGTWTWIPSNSVFHIMSPTPSPYPKSRCSTPQNLEQYSPMPLTITNTDHSCSTDPNFQLLSSAQGQEGLARVAHKRGSPSQTGSYSLPIAAAFPRSYRLDTDLQLLDTEKDADRKIRTVSPDAPKDNEGRDVLANGASSLLSKNDMALRHRNMTLRPSALTGAFQHTLDDNFPGTFPTQATGVQQPTHKVHANALLQQTPDHPRLLPAVDSTNGDGNVGSFAKRSHSPSSGLDTFSCPYDGCTRRFETTLELQKHKRKVHQQRSAGQNGEASFSSVAARQSQAGPHKCKRINPSTGKPCNLIFSRPYDLTRHENTIHNPRKQKIRCYLCPEGKTFSRNDALTRHMRLVHSGEPSAQGELTVEAYSAV